MSTPNANKPPPVPQVPSEVVNGQQNGTIAEPPNEEAEGEAPEEGGMIGGLFSARKPKDAVAGISSGLKSVLKGTMFGAASLVSLPIIGAQEEGAVGFAKG